MKFGSFSLLSLFAVVIISAASAVAAPISGKVLETMDSGGYTYVLLGSDSDQTWVAMPQMEVKPGQQLSVVEGDRHAGYTSKTLNRTFDSIMFSPGPAGTAVAPHGSSKGKIAAEAPLSIQVEKAAGENGYRVSEVFADRDALAGKEVQVRGQVVKVSNGIMGRNWIHLQDGSGSELAGNHDLLVTSQEVVEAGKVVIATGKVVKDKDFGSGYSYKVMLEEVALTH